MFNMLHLMFETQYNELALAVDLIAKRLQVHEKTAWMLRSLLEK